MCGIAGKIGHRRLENEDKILGIMLNLLERRGPDQRGSYFDEKAALLHTRLSVIDIEKGRQPMEFQRGDEHYIIVYNGELYNTEEIRDDLRLRGYGFIGHSDTEVLIKAYAEWGRDCLDKLNGIFAFAVWEKHRRRLFFARDRMGVKPFFYTQKDDDFIFASEIKALLAHPMVEPVIDSEGVAEIMLIGPGRTPGYGVFREIKELKPAYCGYYSERGLELYQYWHLEDRLNTDSLEETVEKVRYLVEDAIERQLVSDVPLGTFLSGGLDSSIISAIANNKFKASGKKLYTFSVNYHDNEKYFHKSKFQPNSDATYIKLMTEALDAEHIEVIIDTPTLVEALYSAVDARDLPGMADVDSSLLVFCREIKQYVTVALSGECADEIFGGYPWFTDPTVREKDGFPWAQSTEYRSRFLREEFMQKIDARQYVYQKYRESIADVSKLQGLTTTEARMKEMARLNMDWFMQTLLDRKDRMSMYSGLEVRVPYCDHRIAEYLYTVPWEYKYDQGVEKGLLRRAMQDLLPNEVLWRKKSPYPKTHNPSYLMEVQKQLSEVINDPLSPILSIVKKSEVEKLLSTGNNPQPWYGQLMTTPQTIAYLLQVNYWLDHYRVRII